MALNISHIVKARRQAHADGDVMFYTGRPCRRGHTTQRYVSTGTCKACAAFHAGAYARDYVSHRSRNAGLVELTVWIHPDDAATIQTLADAMAKPHVDAYNAVVTLQLKRVYHEVGGRLGPMTPEQVADELKKP